MQILRDPAAARRAARALPRPLGFVPTMGALHPGHLALVARARADGAAVAASIFVNPKQFGPQDDFAKYPRAFQSDAEVLEAAGVALLYAPDVETMYPPGFATTVDVGPLGRTLEGARRPGHFAGVALVVLKLLGAVAPDRLYLGQKDVQQTAVLRALARDLDLGTEIVVVPTDREADGLARSSRNVYLTPAQRAAAPSIYRALLAARAALPAPGLPVAGALALAAAAIEPPLSLESLACVDPATFEAMERLALPALLVIVAVAGTTRLLDNLPVAEA